MKHFYKVKITVPEQLAQSFNDWLVPHVQDMLALPCFYEAIWYENKNVDNSVDFLCLYFFNEPSDFQSYLDQFSEQMRGDLPDHFRSELKFERSLGEEKSL